MRAALTVSALIILAACHGGAPAGSKQTESIGVAHMLDDGTVVLDLRTTNSPGLVGEARLTYPKSSKDYEMILKHIGGIKPGEAKSVPPWPDQKR